MIVKENKQRKAPSGWRLQHLVLLHLFSVYWLVSYSEEPVSGVCSSVRSCSWLSADIFFHQSLLISIEVMWNHIVYNLWTLWYFQHPYGFILSLRVLSLSLYFFYFFFFFRFFHASFLLFTNSPDFRGSSFILYFGGVNLSIDSALIFSDFRFAEGFFDQGVFLGFRVITFSVSPSLSYFLERCDGSP